MRMLKLCDMQQYWKMASKREKNLGLIFSSKDLKGIKPFFLDDRRAATISEFTMNRRGSWGCRMIEVTCVVVV